MCVNCERSAMGRRWLLGAGAALLATGRATAQPVRMAQTQQQVLDRLMEGNRRWVADKDLPRQDTAYRSVLAQGQAPVAAVLGCSDSRVPPEIAMDQGPGDLFVARVAGNVVTTEVLGTLEYGAVVLGIPLILVLGHISCGAVKATIDAVKTGKEYPGRIGDLVRSLEPGIMREALVPDDTVEARATVANVRAGVARLTNSSPLLSELIDTGRLGVAGGVFNLSTGLIELI